MKKITLYKPIVLRSALFDMPRHQKDIAIKLLTNQVALVPGKEGLELIDLMDTP